MEREQCLELITVYFLLGLQVTNAYFNRNQQTFISFLRNSKGKIYTYGNYK